MHRGIFRAVRVAALAGGISLLPGVARAAPVTPLQNGGFETGDFTGWSGSGFTDVYTNGNNSNSVSPVTGGPNYSTFIGAQNLNSGNYSSVPTSTNNAVESSQTTSFDGQGPASAIPPVSTAPIAPFDSNYLAFVANENATGNNSLTGSSIQQTFTVPGGATTLSMAVQLLNNDNSPQATRLLHDDFGGVALLQGNRVLGQYNIDIGGDPTADATVTGDTLTGGFYNASGWLSHSFDLTGLTGQQVTLVAYVINYGGEVSVESRLLLDDVTVPEPASLWLLGFSGACLLVRRRRR